MSNAVTKQPNQQVAQSGQQAVVESKEQSASASANVRLLTDDFVISFMFPIIETIHLDVH